MSIAEKLKKYREEKGLSQLQMATMLGLKSQQAYAHYENKGDDISLEAVKRFSKLMGIDLLEEDNKINLLNEPGVTYLTKRRALKQISAKPPTEPRDENQGIPIYNVPIDASFLERYRDDQAHFEPVGFLKLPTLRNCDFAALISGNSMYPLMKSGSIVVCKIIENFDYFDEGEMYFISTINGFETVKYVQTGDNPDELRLIPHNEKIKPSIIKKSMVIRMCLVQAWVNFR